MVKILYVGPTQPGSTCLHRKLCLDNLGCDVTVINTYTNKFSKLQKSLFFRALQKLIGSIDFAKASKQILINIIEKDYSIIWIDKGLTINWKVLKIIAGQKKIKIVGYSPDYMSVKHNTSINFRKSLKYYDYYFTTKSYGVNDLKRLGCKNVYYIPSGFDEKIHFPETITFEEIKKYGGEVGFIGDYEKDRANSVKFLVENGIIVRIWGPNWRRKFFYTNTNLLIEDKILLDEEYRKAICSFKINLAFLRKSNKDLHTTRTFEIPACRAFMIAERTIENEIFFDEGTEAEFFSNNHELLKKINYYLSHNAEREKIASAAFDRCFKSKYSNSERMKEILLIINSL